MTEETEAPGGPLRARRPLSPQAAFLCVGLVFGLLFAALTPPYDVADENIHFATIERIAGGRFLPRGDAPGALPTFPRSLLRLHPRARHGPIFGAPLWTHSWSEMRRLFRIPLHPEQRVEAQRFSPYPAPGYAPQVLGVWIGRVLGLPVVVHLYLGRLGNLLAWLGLCWLAIRICPLRRWSLAVLCLLPMSVFQAGSLSADPLANAAGLLFLATVLRARVGAGALGRDSVLLVLAGALLLGMVKPGYWPLAALAVVIPAERCGGRLRWLGLLAGVAGCTAVPPALWSLVVDLGRGTAPGADPRAQLAWILANPWPFLEVLARTLRELGVLLLVGFVGILGALDVKLPMWLCAAYGVALTWSALADPEDPPLGGWLRLGLVGLFGACGLFVATVAYLSWNPVGGPIVRGLQGRYFLPLAPLLLVALPALRRPIGEPWRSGWIVPAASLGLAYTLLAVVQYYYVGW